MSEWTTRIEPEWTRRYGVEEIHKVCFEPRGWPGKGPVISFGIPECELQFCIIDQNDEPFAIVNRPRRNKKLVLSCDTAEQAERAANMVAKWLSLHRRVALERMYDANSRARDKLV